MKLSNKCQLTNFWKQHIDKLCNFSVGEKRGAEDCKVWLCLCHHHYRILNGRKKSFVYHWNHQIDVDVKVLRFISGVATRIPVTATTRSETLEAVTLSDMGATHQWVPRQQRSRLRHMTLSSLKNARWNPCIWFGLSQALIIAKAVNPHIRSGGLRTGATPSHTHTRIHAFLKVYVCKRPIRAFVISLDLNFLILRTHIRDLLQWSFKIQNVLNGSAWVERRRP